VVDVGRGGTKEKALTPLLRKRPVETVGPPDKVLMRSERARKTVLTTRRRRAQEGCRWWWQWCMCMLPLLLLLLLLGLGARREL